MTVIVTPATFRDVPGMPLVHTDVRRSITEVASNEGGTTLNRVTRIEVSGNGVPLGNHYHNFDEAFVGTGGGVLYTAPADNPADITVHHLPEDGWKVTIPAGIAHTFVLGKPAVLISRTDRHFVSEGNCDKNPGEPINTHTLNLVA